MQKTTQYIILSILKCPENVTVETDSRLTGAGGRSEDRPCKVVEMFPSWPVLMVAQLISLLKKKVNCTLTFL